MESIKRYILMAMLLGVVGCGSQVFAAMGLDEQEVHAQQVQGPKDEGRKETELERATRIREVNKKLFNEARKGNAQGVIDAFELGADVHARDGAGQTALCGLASREVAQVLISKKAGVHVKSNRKFTPLHYARSGGVVFELLNAGALLEAEGEDRETPLRRCCDGLVLTPEQMLGVADTLLAWGANVEARSKYDAGSILQSFAEDIDDYKFSGSLFYQKTGKFLISKLIRARAKEFAFTAKVLPEVRLFVEKRFEKREKVKKWMQDWPKTVGPAELKATLWSMPDDVLGVMNEYLTMPESAAAEQAGAAAVK